MAAYSNLGFGYSFWSAVYSLHLYPTKAEALFKSFLITISWVGGVLYADPRNTNAFFLFSLAMIMEYAVKLVVEQNVLPKIMPVIHIIINTLVFFSMLSRLFRGDIDCPSLFFLYVTGVSIGLIWVDTLVMLFVEHPNRFCHVETRLKSARVKGFII